MYHSNSVVRMSLRTVVFIELLNPNCALYHIGGYAADRWA